ncbi:MULTISPECIES: DJ-1 family glyoxalase III [unclassified Lactobacillus]|uniref:DJ-1 family glyoxalase III n=1 Tax=unclassified Lactobacillus TaxID=2620435 RepID=UPI000EFD793A|nr:MULTISPECIES: DJ-1 family glyoxalase III [unclassified Lactobacillus]RMC23984.1 DJ-1/PfpI family protein [Lactobacillus sp. ESL0247]RMC28355.1 DJ-1/PfpI family protein [Lactobacillus sp. ESL0246]RMC31081.1 DJ-1/PfpI family protein [Lactobacillus sp. ESL0245]
MKKVAVVFANGCEEVEGLSVVDVLRRLSIPTDMVGLTSPKITGDHQIQLICDKVVDDSLLNYDLVAFPGGKIGAENLRDNKNLRDLMVKRHEEGKWNAAMCAAPIALARYGLLDNADYTCYPGFDKQTKQDAPTGKFKETITITDTKHKLITSRGPATAWAYAYAIAEALGVETKELKQGMLYNYLADNIQTSL